MFPPNWVVEKLKEINPRLRLGWCGEPKTFEDGDFPEGHFVLVQMYHPRDAERTLFFDFPETWPIFGGPYDPLRWRPMYKFRVSPRDVFQGTVLDIAKEFSKSAKQQVMEEIEESNYKIQFEYDDRTGEDGTLAEHWAVGCPKQRCHCRGQGAPHWRL